LYKKILKAHDHVSRIVFWSVIVVMFSAGATAPSVLLGEGTGKKMKDKAGAPLVAPGGDLFSAPRMLSLFGKKTNDKKESPLVTKKSSPANSPLARYGTTALSTMTRYIFTSVERIHLLRIFRQNVKKILFLSVCTAVIIVALSQYRSRYEGKRFMTTTRLSIMDKEVQRACRYIEDNYRDAELGLSSISKALVTGEAFLEALFEKELGLTLAGFIQQVRINRVKIMLHRNPAATADVLAQEVGYRNTEEMLEAFRSVSECEFSAYCKALSDGTAA